MKLDGQKRIAAKVLKCSPDRIRFDTERLEDISKAIRRVDIRGLISQGAISKIPARGTSRGRARHNIGQKQKGKQDGHGSRKGRSTARLPAKGVWINKVRLQRRVLKYLRDNEKITTPVYRELYMKSKGGFFRSKRHLWLYINEHNMMSKK